jgi:hypothetical protein
MKRRCLCASFRQSFSPLLARVFRFSLKIIYAIDTPLPPAFASFFVFSATLFSLFFSAFAAGSASRSRISFRRYASDVDTAHFGFSARFLR